MTEFSKGLNGSSTGFRDMTSMLQSQEEKTMADYRETGKLYPFEKITIPQSAHDPTPSSCWGL